MTSLPTSAAFVVAVAISSLASASGLAAQEGALELFTGGTLFYSGTRIAVTEVFKFEERFYDGSRKVSDPFNQRQIESRTVLSVDHGLRRDVTFSVLAPFVYRERRVGGFDLNATGLGDIATIVKYQPFRDDWHLGAFAVSVSGGLEIPTGKTDARDRGMRLGPALQPGSGAWNPFVAVAVTYEQDLWRFDTSLLFKHNTEGSQNFERGDFLNYNLSAAYRFLLEPFPGPAAKFTLILSWRREGRGELNGVTAPNTGSTQLFVRPHLTWHPDPATDIGLSVDVPVYQDVHGQQLVRDYTVNLTFGYRF